MIKGGQNDGIYSTVSKNLVHAVFPSVATDVHGDVYAYVSQWLSETCSDSKLPFVPHIVQTSNSNQNLRAMLGIPKNALVIGCYGGSDSFDIKFAQDCVIKSANDRFDLYFLFMNINKFSSHNKIIYLKGTSSMETKSTFINTCDAMIHARGLGESFGLACGEFSCKNKPVITYAHSPHKSHIHILADKALQYENKAELMHYLLSLQKRQLENENWDNYSKIFSPEIVMDKFQNVFLK